MNYKIPKLNKQQIKKAAACLTIVAGLFLGISAFYTLFSPTESNSTLPACASGTNVGVGTVCTFPSCATTASPNPGVNCLPSCASVSGTAAPGVNCYYLNLPLCSSTSTSVSVSDAGVSPIPRVNCADLIDMPLCSQIDPDSSGVPAKNCVSECDLSLREDSISSGHNVTCVRFCDHLPAGITANPRTNSSVGNCVQRQCQKLNYSVLPTDSNCTKLPCNLLLPEELDESRMQNDNDPYFAQYCDGSTVKCYNFTAAQLPYARYRYNNPICQIHKCKPAAESCGKRNDCVGFTLGNATTDDTQNIACNTTSLTFSDGSVMSYPDLYSRYVNIGLPLTDLSLCTPVSCKPTVYNPYPCTRDSSNNLTIPPVDQAGAPLCDTSGDGATCATTACVSGSVCKKDLGYCYKTTDCNLSANATNQACLSNPSNDTVDDQINLADDTNSAFYRPVPLNKAYTNNDPRQGYRISGACYTKDEMKNQSDNRPANGCSNGRAWGCDTRVNLGLFWVNLGYFHMQWGPDDITRSPKMCDVPKNGFRGTGYLHLCGNSQNLYARISEKTAYYEGYVQTQFMDDSDAVSTVRVCLRFKNTIRPDDVTMDDSETCGSRECAVSCAFGACKGQICGDETCRSLTVRYSESKRCALNNEMFLNNDDNRPCAVVIDNFLRLRAVQYGHRICTFIDVKGTFAYNNMFFNENEKLDNGVTCVSGSYNPNNGRCSGGKNSNDDPGLADRWRTILKVRYTGANDTKVIDGVTTNGFYQKDGKFIKAQECAQIPLTTSPPNMYNLTTAQNTIKLFAPPLFLRSVHNKRGGSDATDSTASSLGTTDFLYPEIVVQFGTATRTLSMGPGFSGYEVIKDPLSYALDSGELTTVLNGVTYRAGALIKKEVDSISNQPKLCLYQRVSSNSGFEDIKISCVNRSFPEINNTGKASATTIGVRKISITGSTNTANVLNNGIYGNSSISLTHCADASCTNTGDNTMTFTNFDPSTPVCMGANENNFEKYKICAQREICSKLWKECMENEIAIQNNGLNSIYNSVRTDCQALAYNCNAKKGITSPATSLIDQANDSAPSSNAYGWYNELCIVSGFATKLGKVYGNNDNGGTGIGKCKLATGTSATCPNGGNAAVAGCACLDASSGLVITGYTIRNQTAREAGLCVDIPTPQICPSYNYGGDSYNASSLDGTNYTNASGTVNLQHNNRNISNVNAISGTGGHGEFTTAVVGMNNVTGTCNGFWQAASAGTSPQMNCVLSGANAKWTGVISSATSTSCVRYSCSAISTGSASLDSDTNGLYPAVSPYFSTAAETGDSINETAAAAGNDLGITYNDVTLSTRGLSNGYATWAAYTKTNDFLETVTATSCIAGYRGTLPTRACNQTGTWKPVNSVCQRRMCNAITPPFNPTTTNGNGDGNGWADGGNGWTGWSLSRGATFGVEVYLKTDYDPVTNPSGHYLGEPILSGSSYRTHLTPASRSLSGATVGSIRKGYCNTKLGYFQTSANQPEATCQSDGTWSAIRNPCATSCTAIGSADAPSNGNATWAAITRVPIDGRTTCQAGDCTGGTCVAGICIGTGTCSAGYQRYPYSPTKDNNGDPITGTININNPVESAPHRTCKLQLTAGGYASVWSATSSSCINTCPGYLVDNREGVGKTTYNDLTVRWDSVAAGVTNIQTVAYRNNSDTVLVGRDSNGRGDEYFQTASHYDTQGRTNGYFIVTRRCNNDLTWGPAIIQCPTNGGVVNNANFGTALINPSPSLISSFVPADNNYTASSCLANFSSSSMPVYRCQASTGNNLNQYYYNHISGNACSGLQCNLTNNTPYGSGSIYAPGAAAGTSVVAAGSPPINLSCKSGYGHAIREGEGSDSTCGGRTVYDRISAGPTMTCTASASGGSASWVVSNDCQACRNCSGTARLPSDGSINLSWSKTNRCKKGAETYKCTTQSTISQSCAGTVINGATFTCTDSDSCKADGTAGSCNYHLDASATVQCNDGYFIFTSSSCRGDC